MRRILHTADWHLGHVLNGHGRLAEHRAVMDWLVEQVAAEAVDALIVAGDVFDIANPPAEARALLFDTLDRLHRVAPGLSIILVAGNHDHAAQLEAPDALLRRVGARVIGGVRRTADRAIDLDHHLIPIGDPVEAVVLAIPYPRPTDLPAATAAVEPGHSPRIAAVRALHEEAIAAAKARFPDVPLIVTGHLTVAGADETKASERSILIGGEHAVPADVFPLEAAYVALGHLHKPQAIGRPTIRYSGSLFPLSATERAYGHSMTLIEIDGPALNQRLLPIPRPVAFLRVPAEGAASPGTVAGLLAGLGLPATLPARDGPFVHLVVAVEGAVSPVRAELARLIEALPIRLAGPIEFVRPGAAPAQGMQPADPRRLSEFDPIDLFRAAFEQTHGRAPTPAHESRFRDLLARQAAP